jgi:hypothetical protein
MEVGCCCQAKVTLLFAVRGKSAQGGSISVRVVSIEAAQEVRRRMGAIGATQIRIYRRAQNRKIASPTRLFSTEEAALIETS